MKLLFDLSKTDWDLLHQQKLSLLEVQANLKKQEQTDSIRQQIDDLEGLLNWIDDIQDQAEDMSAWKFPEPQEDEEDEEIKA